MHRKGSWIFLFLDWGLCSVRTIISVHKHYNCIFLNCSYRLRGLSNERRYQECIDGRSFLKRLWIYFCLTMYTSYESSVLHRQCRTKNMQRQSEFNIVYLVFGLCESSKEHTDVSEPNIHFMRCPAYVEIWKSHTGGRSLNASEFDFAVPCLFFAIVIEIPSGPQTSMLNNKYCMP